MKTKEEIVQNWLPRYTGEALENFGEYILLTNFSNYVKMFAEWNNVEVIGEGKPMQCATADNISIINFGMGSPTAATIMDLLSAINPMLTSTPALAISSWNASMRGTSVGSSGNSPASLMAVARTWIM